MKTSVRILVGILGLVAIFFGVKQIIRGTKELSGQAPVTQTQKLGETYTSTENGYSYRIPEGWEQKPPPQTGIVMIGAPKESGFAGSNMVTTTEAYQGTLRAYADANIKSVQTSMPDAKLVSDNEFVPNNKASSYKIKFSNKLNQADLAQSMYFFDGSEGRKIIVTCTATAKQGPDLEPLFDDCMKTFALSGK